LSAPKKSLSLLKLILFSILMIYQSAHAQVIEVALAGIAYSGSASTIKNRFPYSQQYEEQKKNAGTPIHQDIYQAISKMAPENLKITPQIEEIKGRDQALVTALVVGSETISIEQFGQAHKLMVLIRGQAMFFDFKSMNIVRSYPISFAYVDLLDHVPTQAEVLTRVKMVYEGANDKPGLIGRFANTVAKAKMPSQVSRYIQIADVQIKPEALSSLPDYIKSEPGAVETWAADLAGEAISTRAGIPIIPYAKGYAIGNVMSMRISDGEVWELKLPKPDYEISIEFSGFKKVKFSEVEGGATSYVYGAYSGIKINEPLSGKIFLETPLKNGETSVIPASQKYIDDFPHFYNALNLTFVKLAQVLDGRGDEKWMKSATSAKNIDQQISQTRELIKTCK
jgi:hypothetical protein